MTDLIPRDAVISPEVMRVWTAANIHHADEAVFLDAVAAIREAALKEAASECQRIAGNTKDFHAYHRRAAGQCAAMILALIGEKK